MTIVLSIATLLSTTCAVGYAADGSEQETGDTYFLENIGGDAAQANSVEYTEDIDLETQESTMLLNGEVYSLVNTSAPDDLEIDISEAVQIASFQQNGTVLYNTAENQPPVTNTGIYLLNPESLKDEEYTTETQYLIPKRLDGVDVCYDPEGGPIELIHNDSFPSGYVVDARNAPGLNAGYVIHIFNEGYYPFVFAFVDQDGGTSEIFSFVFDIVRRGVFEAVDGELTSVTDKNVHTITVDYSTADKYYIGYLRTGFGGFSINIQYPDGTKASGGFCSGPYAYQDVENGVVLKKPEGVSGECTYIIEVSTSSSLYVDGQTSYRLAYGEESQAPYFFEDVSDSMVLPHFYNQTSGTKNLERYLRETPISDYGNYYEITPTGTETVTLSSQYGRIRFKILDTVSFETLFDSYSIEPHTINDSLTTSSSYFTVVNLNFTAGATYYLVVYNTSHLDNKEANSITVGDHRLTLDKATYPIDSMSVSKGSMVTCSFNLNAPNGRPSYVETVSYSCQMPAWSDEYSVLTPGSSIWRTGFFSSDIKFKLGEASPVRADGAWRFRFAPMKSGVYPGGELRIYYYYEII